MTVCSQGQPQNILKTLLSIEVCLNLYNMYRLEVYLEHYFTHNCKTLLSLSIPVEIFIMESLQCSLLFVIFCEVGVL